VFHFGDAGQQTAIADDDDARGQVRVLQTQADFGSDACRLA